MYELLGVYVNYYWDIQKTRITLNNRIKSLEKLEMKTVAEEQERISQMDKLLSFATQMENIEANVAKEITQAIKGIPIWEGWLKDIKGIGPLYAAQLVHLIVGKKHTPECLKRREKYFSKKKPGEKRAKRFTCDCPSMEIDRFPTVSSLWKYAGLHVVGGKAPKRKRGQKVNWNPKLRSLCWKIAKSFLMAGGEYRFRYDEFKKQETEKNGGRLSKTHIDMRARRKTVKLFLAHLFSKWYERKGLSAPDPYPQSMLGHKGYIPPPE